MRTIKKGSKKGSQFLGCSSYPKCRFIKESKEEHINSLKDRYASDTVCPKCSSNLVMRTIKKGSKKGSQFLGCSSYPKCRFIKESKEEKKN